mmetsp:Transcript_11475/g.17311  ORF Transcript_11475/g.17311 Transcript_11475/m.17311 type:complete len:83 (-) Transcript_11475:1462-1710(-)
MCIMGLQDSLVGIYKYETACRCNEFSITSSAITSGRRKSTAKAILRVHLINAIEVHYSHVNINSSLPAKNEYKTHPLHFFGR